MRPPFRRMTVIREVTSPSSLVNCLVAIQRSEAKFVSVTTCHPDRSDNASGWLLASGQLRASGAGSGFEIAQRSLFSTRLRRPHLRRHLVEPPPQESTLG